MNKIKCKNCSQALFSIHFLALDDGLQELWATNDDYLEYKFIIVSDKEAVLLDHGTDIFIGKYRHALLSDFKGLLFH